MTAANSVQTKFLAAQAPIAAGAAKTAVTPAFSKISPTLFAILLFPYLNCEDYPEFTKKIKEWAVLNTERRGMDFLRELTEQVLFTREEMSKVDVSSEAFLKALSERVE